MKLLSKIQVIFFKIFLTKAAVQKQQCVQKEKIGSRKKKEYMIINLLVLIVTWINLTIFSRGCETNVDAQANRS